MRNWRRFWGLALSDKRSILQAALLLTLVALGRRCLPLAWLQRGLTWLLPPVSGSAPSDAAWLDRARRCIYPVQVAARYGIVRATCLERALVTQALLRRNGIEGHIRLGVRRVEGRFDAHAWVEAHGVVLNDRADIADTFQALPPLPNGFLP